MSERELFSLKSEDPSQDLGTVYSDNQATLRAFGASYMRDPSNKGNLAIHDPKGRIIAAFDVWIGDWTEAAET